MEIIGERGNFMYKKSIQILIFTLCLLQANDVTQENVEEEMSDETIMIMERGVNEKLCNEGVEEGCYRLTYYYKYGEGGVEKNKGIVNELLFKACKGGHDQACEELSHTQLYEIFFPREISLVDSYKVKFKKLFIMCVEYHDIVERSTFNYCGDFKIRFARKIR